MSSSVEFSVADIPPGAGDPVIVDIDSGSTSSDDLTCQVCGVGLTYGGRGRKPKFCDDHKKSSSSGSSTRSSGARAGAEVEAAMAALDGLHTVMSMALMVIAPTAALEWQSQLPALNDRNRGILGADKELAKKIAKMASKGSSPMLFLSYGAAIAPVAGAASMERRARREAKAQAEWEAEHAADAVSL